MCVVASPISTYASRRKASVRGGGRGEAFGDGARPIATRDAVAPQQRSDLGVGVQGGQPWVHLVLDGVPRRWSAAAYRDAVVVQGA